MSTERPPAKLIAVADFHRAPDLPAEFAPGDYRWAIYDRKIRTLFYGPKDVHIHMTVAERAGVLRHPPSYYQHGGNVLGGFVCRSRDGDFYYDPFSGTFPGTDEGVREAQEAFTEICAALDLDCRLYDGIPNDRKVMHPPSLPEPLPVPDMEQQQGVLLDGEFVEAQMMSAELVADRTRHQLAALDAAEDDATRRRCLEALIQTVRIYGQPAIDTIAGRGLSPERLVELLASLPPEA